MIELSFKMLKKFKIGTVKIFPLVRVLKTYGHNLKVRAKPFRSNIKDYSFSSKDRESPELFCFKCYVCHIIHNFQEIDRTFNRFLLIQVRWDSKLMWVN